jgi:hypothetical protein
MNQDGELYVLAQCDIIAIDPLLIECVYQRVKGLGIKKEHITIVATHTHAGPSGVFNTSEGLFEQMQGIFGMTDMPLIEISNYEGNFLRSIIIVFVWIGLFTTLTSSVYVLKNILSNIKISERMVVVFVLFGGLVFSYCRFEILVNYIYILIGIVGLYMVFKSYKKERELIILSSRKY